MSTHALVQDRKEKVPMSVHLMCGWPLALVAVGGMIGGGLGGAAYGINMAVYRSDMPTPVKVLLNIAVGGAAVVGWLIAASFIQGAMR